MAMVVVRVVQSGNGTPLHLCFGKALRRTKHIAKIPSSIVTITFVSCRLLKAVFRYKIVMYAAEVLLLGRSSNDEAM